jgi:hypothetical protein
MQVPAFKLPACSRGTGYSETILYPAKHPNIESIEPGEHWAWRFVDDMMAD